MDKEKMFLCENLYIAAEKEDELKAAEILSEELYARTGVRPPVKSLCGGCFIRFQSDADMNRDCFAIRCENADSITVKAFGIRGFMFGIGTVLKKSVYGKGCFSLIYDICGSYRPEKEIRGHQLGYRTTPNTYDAWSYDDYYRYFKDLMFMLCNTMEHTHFPNKPENYNALMKYDEYEFLKKTSELADSLDMDVSVWYPNDESPVDEYLASRRKVLEIMPRIDAIFPPGGDPGCFDADEFVSRSEMFGKMLKEIHPEAKMYPSAQTPHAAGWGDKLISEMEKLPVHIDGIVTGPNRAFDMDTLRRKLPSRYPIRFYPDITHNVRCEYPVHYMRDDWHFALASTLSRESINPRIREYATLHKLTRQYINGGVSYSEGVSDDVNKFVWSSLDFDSSQSLREIIEDYARLFLYDGDTDDIVNGIFGLENNWDCDPELNSSIEYTYYIFSSQAEKHPVLMNNWRFVSLLFRAECDMLVRKRRIFENRLVSKACEAMKKGDISPASEILDTPFDEAYNSLRSSISAHGQLLFELIGMQLDVEHYHADRWERGAVLDTIDNNVTDRAWLKNRLAYAEQLDEKEKISFIDGLINRNRVDTDEYYFSFALHGFDVLGKPQTPDFYMDFQGDNPETNNGSMPTCMFKVFDHFTFDMKTGGLTADCDYRLILNIKPRYRDEVEHFTIKVNGTEIYNGKQYGGDTDRKWDEMYSAPRFETHSYVIPKELIVNGCVEIEIREPKVGIMFSELRIVKT